MGLCNKKNRIIETSPDINKARTCCILYSTFTIPGSSLHTANQNSQSWFLVLNGSFFMLFFWSNFELWNPYFLFLWANSLFFPALAILPYQQFSLIYNEDLLYLFFSTLFWLIILLVGWVGLGVLYTISVLFWFRHRDGLVLAQARWPINWIQLLGFLLQSPAEPKETNELLLKEIIFIISFFSNDQLQKFIHNRILNLL